MAEQSVPSSRPDLRYVDRENVSETLVDSLEQVSFDGATARIELVVYRVDKPKPGGKMTGQKVTACRLVLSLSSLMEITNRLNMFLKGLQQQEVIQPLPKTPPSTKMN